MICPHCQSEIYDDSRFCKECGHLTTPLVDDAGEISAPQMILPGRKRPAGRAKTHIPLRYAIAGWMRTAAVILVLTIGLSSASLIFRSPKLRKLSVGGIDNSLRLARKAVARWSSAARLLLFVSATSIGLLVVARLVSDVEDRALLGPFSLAYTVVSVLAFLVFGLFCVRMRTLAFFIRGEGLSYVMNVICFGLGTGLGLLTKAFNE